MGEKGACEKRREREREKREKREKRDKRERDRGAPGYDSAPSYDASIQGHPREKERNLRSRQVPMNLIMALVALTTLRR